MTIAFVTGAHVTLGTNSNGGDSSGSPIDTSTANFLVMMVGSVTSSGFTPPTISDSKSNFWTPLTAVNENTYNSSRARIYYAKNAIVGSGHTFTASGTSSFPSACIAAFSGVDTTAPFDQENGIANVFATTSLQAGSITPSEDNELIIAGLTIGQAGTSGEACAGYTLLDVKGYNGGAAYYGSALAYLIQTTAGATNPTWSWTGNAVDVAVIASFKQSAGGGGGGGSAVPVFMDQYRSRWAA